MSLKEVARETLKFLDNGQYTSPGGNRVVLAAEQRAAVDGTRLYTPEQGLALHTETESCSDGEPCIEVRPETTQIATSRLVQGDGCEDVVLLNFASARNPGGGFVNGAKAQEEDLARCSGIYPCLLTQPTYFDVNRAQESLLYTDHIIYSPNVPWFRTKSRNLLDEIFLASVITAPAPNAGQTLRRDPEAGPRIEEALRRRAGIVLAIARHHGHRNLVLGAWGCGVFGNEPAVVADAFGRWLESDTFRGCFDRIVFAIYDRVKGKPVLGAFQHRFSS